MPSFSLYAPEDIIASLRIWLLDPQYSDMVLDTESRTAVHIVQNVPLGQESRNRAVTQGRVRASRNQRTPSQLLNFSHNSVSKINRRGSGRVALHLIEGRWYHSSSPIFTRASKSQSHPLPPHLFHIPRQILLRPLAPQSPHTLSPRLHLRPPTRLAKDRHPLSQPRHAIEKRKTPPHPLPLASKPQPTPSRHVRNKPILLLLLLSIFPPYTRPTLPHLIPRT